MDKITISGLQVHSLIGVYDWEREAKQMLLVDIELQLDLQKAADSDDVADTIDYAAVAKCLEAVADASQFQLLEALAKAMLDALFDNFPVFNATLALVKPEILPNASRVAVQLSRAR